MNKFTLGIRSLSIESSSSICISSTTNGSSSQSALDFKNKAKSFCLRFLYFTFSSVIVRFPPVFKLLNAFNSLIHDFEINLIIFFLIYNE